jgi:hypothetical protein
MDNMRFSGTTLINGVPRPVVSDGCDAYYPLYYDTYHVDLEYRFFDATFQPQNLRSAKISTNQMSITFEDASPTEWGYWIDWQYNTGSGWVAVGSVPHYSNAFGDHAQWGTLSRTFTKPANLPTASYRGCMYTVTAPFGQGYYKCFPARDLGAGSI